MKHIILPPLREYGVAELREGRASSAIVYNSALRDAAEAIKRAGFTYSHEIAVRSIYLDDAFRVDTFGCERVGLTERVQATANNRERLRRAVSALSRTT
ncbi:hypothetical protein [Pantoea stewartii]|uniref:Uncharacterized protein n=1 Tax=Pantoea stewartii subsp. stewartii DC283 TaxID=660596 RepID=H3RLL5_PANSE|nr:hypothetical protein [Pantoea stewartii]ARF52772.1 hypothetical protein DSJ_26555 [Pantoea stewartii subsp. stewartii DC283]EHT97728.1 hypothetical protein CKS_5590 [Pantoea stewartii subsp. stewartii DC283]KAB0553995.1 hypothetical protein F7Q90_12445 [Pantoea stewartii subsp. stewartii]